MWDNCTVTVLANPGGGFKVIHGEVHGDVRIAHQGDVPPTEQQVMRGMMSVLEGLHALEATVYLGYGLRLNGWGAEAWLWSWNLQV